MFTLFKSKAFQAMIWLLLIFILIWIGKQISYVFHPIIVLVTTLFIPVLISGLLYYLINPAVDFLSKGRFPRIVAILLIYIIFFGLLSLGVIALGPVLTEQLSDLISNSPDFLARLYDEFLQIQDTGFLARFERFDPFASWQDFNFEDVVDNLLTTLAGNITGIAGMIANSAIIVFTIPFILFYMLKDGRRFPYSVSRSLPEPYRQESITLIQEVNKTLRSYVQGQLLISLFVAIVVYIGYKIIGLEYALLLAIIAGITNVIPFFGPILGIIPGLIVGFLQSPWTGLQVIIIILIVQQVESQLLSPQVLGKKMAIHPVVIIFVLLTAGSLAGIFGFILGIPIYAVARVVVSHVYSFVKSSKQIDQKT